MKDFYAAAAVLSESRDICLKTDIEKSCQNSSYFYCNQSMKCVSKHRVRDARFDFFFGKMNRSILMKARIQIDSNVHQT
jgi:hypothetical protein